MTAAAAALPFNDRDGAVAFLSALAQRGAAELPIAQAALAFAALDRPGVDLERYHHHLAALARETSAAAQGAVTLEARIAALNSVLRGSYRYEGDRLTYEDLQNANLMRVIDRRRGLPVALGILYLHAGRAQGWIMAGLAFPGHFLLRIEDSSSRAVLDPFNDGTILGAQELRRLLSSVTGGNLDLTPAHYAAVCDRDVLLRLQNNLKLRLNESGQRQRALEIIERMRLLAPDRAELVRESGIVLAELGQLAAAIRMLEKALAIERDSGLRFATAALVQDLKARLQ